MLKLEEISIWYPPVVQLLNLSDVVSSGWNKKLDRVSFSRTACFYHPPALTCEDYLKLGMPQLHSSRSSKCKRLTAHSKCARSKLHLLTPDAVRLLTEYYSNDFSTLNYTKWNGFDAFIL